jgi:hypothetical protein
MWLVLRFYRKSGLDWYHAATGTPEPEIKKKVDKFQIKG